MIASELAAVGKLHNSTAQIEWPDPPRETFDLPFEEALLNNLDVLEKITAADASVEILVEGASSVLPRILDLAQQAGVGVSGVEVVEPNPAGDDAGVYRLDETRALVVTADFITPVVDDAYTFGRVAAANSLSDVFAMGGRPVTCLNLVAFPSGKLGAQVLLERRLPGAEQHALGERAADGRDALVLLQNLA